MPRLLLSRAGLGALVLLAACGRRDASPPAAEAAAEPFQVPASRPGQLSIDGADLRFVACGERGPGVRLTDTPDGTAAAALRALGAGPAGATVLLRVLGGQVLSVRYAALEGTPCDRLPAAAVLEARGTEPFWSLDVEPTGATFRTPEAPAGTGYPSGSWSRPDPAHWRYRARWTGDAGPDSLRLDLAEEPCADPMSGARYAFRATLVVGGRTWTGCAMEGKQAMSYAADGPHDPVPALVGPLWRLTRFGDQAVAPGATLEFQAGDRVIGGGYCNRFFAPARVRGTEVQLGPVASTRKACADSTRQQQEVAYFRALESAERLAGDGPALLVYVRGMEAPLRFEPGVR